MSKCHNIQPAMCILNQSQRLKNDKIEIQIARVQIRNDDDGKHF